jgi:tetratricopeptide (TPR) repeat protein
MEEQQARYSRYKLGLALEAENKWREAETVHREALAVARKEEGNTGPDALTDLVRLARVLVAENKPGEAQKLLDDRLTPAFLKQPAAADFVTDIVNMLGRSGQWEAATAKATLLLQLQPANHYNYHRLAALLVITGNRTAYEQLFPRMLMTFTNSTDPYVYERMVQDGLLLPHSGADLAAVDKLADTAVTLGSGRDALPYFQACKAMSDYRLGHFPEAIEWGAKAAKSPLADAPAKAKAEAVLAMANWQLGQKDAAQASLAEGNTLAPSLQPGNGAQDLGESWVAWLFARISLDEAAALIQSASANEISLKGT